MKPVLAYLAVAAVLGGSACTNSPEIAVAAVRTANRVASARGAIPAHEIRNALLFASARGDAGDGGAFLSRHGRRAAWQYPERRIPLLSPSPNVAGASAPLREGDMVFATDPGPADGQDVRDAVVVVISSQPELRSRLSDPARRQLELFKLAAK